MFAPTGTGGREHRPCPCQDRQRAAATAVRGHATFRRHRRPWPRHVPPPPPSVATPRSHRAWHRGLRHRILGCRGTRSAAKGSAVHVDASKQASASMRRRCARSLRRCRLESPLPKWLARSPAAPLHSNFVKSCQVDFVGRSFLDCSRIKSRAHTFAQTKADTVSYGSAGPCRGESKP
jgi:hypothetical protein